MPDSLRIVFVITRADDIGGAQIHVRDLATALTAQGHSVAVVSGPPGVLSDALAKRGVSFRSLPHLGRPIRPMRDFRALLELREALRELKPDVVSTHSSKAGILGRIAARTLGLPVLFTAHGWSFGEGRPWPHRWFYQILERVTGPLGSRIITVSHVDHELALRAHIAPAGNLITIHNAMPRLAEERVAEAGREPPRLIMVARFAAPKVHALLLRALQRLEHRPWSLTFVGTGPDMEPTRTLARELGLGDRVDFLGYRADVPDLLVAHQIFVLVSRFEGFPRSIIEAMRAGLPVVSTDVGGVREAVLEGRTGYLVPFGEADLLADRLERLLDDPALRATMGTSALERYRENFTLDRLVDETLTVYRDVLVGRDVR